MTGRSPSNIAVGGALVGLGAAAATVALTIPVEADGDAGARFFPLIASGALVVLGALELRNGADGRSPASSPDARATDPRTVRSLATADESDATGERGAAVDRNRPKSATGTGVGTGIDVGTGPAPVPTDVARDHEPFAKPGPEGGRTRVLALLVLAIGYAWLVGKLGYLVPTALAIALALVLFGRRRPSTLLVAALVCPLVYHLVFFEALGVFPPFGEWFDLLDGWRGR